MHKVSLPKPVRHPWELTEASSSYLAYLHYWTWVTTETTALKLKGLKLKTCAERKNASD